MIYREREFKFAGIDFLVKFYEFPSESQTSVSPGFDGSIEIEEVFIGEIDVTELVNMIPKFAEEFERDFLKSV